MTARMSLLQVIFRGRYHPSAIVVRKVGTYLVRGGVGMDEIEERVVRGFAVDGEMVPSLYGTVGGAFLRREAYRLW